MVKNPLANVRDIRDQGLIPGLGKSLGGRHGNPLQYSCLENPIDREARRVTVLRFSELDTTDVTYSMHNQSINAK